MADELLELLPDWARERYSSPELLGCGGKGHVYRARDGQLGCPVALKVISPRLAGDRRERHRFKREILTIARLDHPNIVRLYDFSDTDAVMFYTMELLEGRSLQDVIQTDDMTIGEAVDMVRQVVAGVAAVHRAGVFHRDLKPSNVVVTDDGTAKVIDFGAVKHAVDGNITAITMRGHVVGTILYQPPEAFSAEGYSERSDVYQLGLMLYEALTGCHPLESFLVNDIISGSAQARIPAPSSVCAGVDATLSDLVMACLSPDASNRPADADALAASLTLWAKSQSLADGPVFVEVEPDDASETGESTVVIERRRRSPWRRRILPAAVALGMVAFGLIGYHVIRDYRRGGSVSLPATGPIRTGGQDGLLSSAAAHFSAGDDRALAAVLLACDSNDAGAAPSSAAIVRAALGVLHRSPEAVVAAGSKLSVDQSVPFSTRGDLFARVPLLDLIIAASHKGDVDAFRRASHTVLCLTAPQDGRGGEALRAIDDFVQPMRLASESASTAPSATPLQRRTRQAASTYDFFFAFVEVGFRELFRGGSPIDDGVALLELLERAHFYAWQHDEFRRRHLAMLDQWRRMLQDRLSEQSCPQLFAAVVYQQAALTAGPLAPLAPVPPCDMADLPPVERSFIAGLRSFVTAYGRLWTAVKVDQAVAASFSTALRQLRRATTDSASRREIRRWGRLLIGRALCGLAIAKQRCAGGDGGTNWGQRPAMLDDGPLLRTGVSMLAAVTREHGAEVSGRLAAFHRAHNLWLTKGRALEGYRAFQRLIDDETEMPVLGHYVTKSAGSFTATPP